jgi:hypothetical protein
MDTDNVRGFKVIKRADYANQKKKTLLHKKRLVECLRV